MTAGPVAPTRLRRRLAVVFVLAVGVGTGVMAVATYVIVRHELLRDSADRASADAILNFRFAERQTAPSFAVLRAFRGRGQFATVIIARSATAQSSPNIGPTQVPVALRRTVDTGHVARSREKIASRHYVVVGAPLPGRAVQYYLFYSEQQVWDDLQTLQDVLPVVWVVMVALAALGGIVVARRTLAPVALASDAARALAEGLLDTRLPVAGEDEFGAWATSFNEMATALQAKIAALADAHARERRFTANVAHELMTPLGGLVGEAHLLADTADQLPPEARRLALMLVRDADRLRRMTNDLLEVSRLDAASEPTVVESVEVRSVVGGVIRACGWEEQVQLDAAPLLVETDPRRLERIVTNMVGNAVSHGAPPIRVAIARTADCVEVEVADSGSGIPADALPHVFDRFYKADPSRHGGGSGLGLAIARENARLLGGDITAASSPGCGAVFTLRVPVAELRPESGHRVAGATDHQPMGTGSPTRQR